MQREIDMAPYEEQFTELERLYYERTAVMNIVAYMTDRQFSDSQYKKVFNDYLKISKDYDNYIGIFENNIIIPLCGPVSWKADFERRVLYVE